MKKVYKTNITKGFCFQWSRSKACMEYVSNALDEGDYNFDINYEQGSLEVTNFNVKLDPKALMLGLSSKREDNTKRGCFGSGLPQSIAALLDQGCSVTLVNNDVLWETSFSHCDDWGYEVLTFKESVNPSPNTNLTVLVEGLSEEDLDEVKSRTLALQQREVLFSTEYGDVIAHGEDNGEIFCGDMYVCENNSFKHSYNFAPKVLPLNQDRNSADQWEISRLTAKIWKQCPDKELLVEAIKSKKADCEYVMDSWYTSDSSSLSVSEEFGEEFIKKYDNHIVTSDFTEYEELTKCGNKVKYLDNSNQVKAIKESVAYNDMISSMEIIEVESTRTKVERIILAFQQLVIDHGHEEIVYEGFTMQEHINTLDEIIHEL